MKVLILVLAADNNGYDKMISAIKNTWGSKSLPDIEVFYYYGYRNNHPRPLPGKLLLMGKDMICDTEETINNIGFKTLRVFDYILNNFSFDYVFRCCAGSYINQANLINFIKNKPVNNFYCGIIGNVDGIRYASGSGYFLSKDLVKYTVDNAKLWNHNLIDDMALGKLLEGRVKIDESAKRVDIPSDGNVLINSSMISDDYHYHFRKQPEMMLKIHRILNNEQIRR